MQDKEILIIESSTEVESGLKTEIRELLDQFKKFNNRSFVAFAAVPVVLAIFVGVAVVFFNDRSIPIYIYTHTEDTHTEGEKAGKETKIPPLKTSKIEISVSVMLSLLLIISFTFFYLYMVHVYPKYIEQVYQNLSGSDNNE